MSSEVEGSVVHRPHLSRTLRLSVDFSTPLAMLALKGRNDVLFSLKKRAVEL
jgi:hypothetical protein